MTNLFDRRWIQFQMMAMDKGWGLEVDFIAEKCIVVHEGKEAIFNLRVLQVYSKEFIAEQIEKEFGVLDKKIQDNRKVKKSKRVTFVVFDELVEYD